MIDLFVKGGFAMYPLLALSVVTLAIAIERMVYLRKAQIDTGKFMEGINGFLARNALEEAYRFCDSTSGPISRKPTSLASPLCIITCLDAESAATDSQPLAEM